MSSLVKHLSSEEGTRMVPSSGDWSLEISLEQILMVSAASVNEVIIQLYSFGERRNVRVR